MNINIDEWEFFKHHRNGLFNDSETFVTARHRVTNKWTVFTENGGRLFRDANEPIDSKMFDNFVKNKQWVPAKVTVVSKYILE